MRESLLDKTAAELREALVATGLEPYRAGQLLRWVHARGARELEPMTDLPREMRERLSLRWDARALEIAAEHRSEDGTRKLALRADDGASIEAVVIPEERRRTLCVSSQVGCSLDCGFCATGRLGLGRNLAAAEIVDQVRLANRVLADDAERVTHVVFMGMGEPLLNLREVIRAIRVMIDPAALALPGRRITVSTAGVVPRIRALGEAVPVRLAVSLHATTDEVRDRLVPLNRRFPLAELLAACRAYPAARGEPISFEYTLIEGVNDGEGDAHRLVRLLSGLRAKVNLIALNEHPGTDLRRPADPVVDRFARVLADARMRVSVRRSRGGDIFAACGQLGALAPGGPAHAARGAELPVR